LRLDGGGFTIWLGNYNLRQAAWKAARVSQCATKLAPHWEVIICGKLQLSGQLAAWECRKVKIFYWQRRPGYRTRKSKNFLLTAWA